MPNGKTILINKLRLLPVQARTGPHQTNAPFRPFAPKRCDEECNPCFATLLHRRCALGNPISGRTEPQGQRTCRRFASKECRKESASAFVECFFPARSGDPRGIRHSARSAWPHP